MQRSNTTDNAGSFDVLLVCSWCLVLVMAWYTTQI